MKVKALASRTAIILALPPLLGALAAPPSAAAGPSWDYAYFPDAAPESSPAGAWQKLDYLRPPDLEPSLSGGRLDFDIQSHQSELLYYRDSASDPNIAATEMTVEWRQTVLSAGHYELTLGGATSSPVDLLFRGFDFPGFGEYDIFELSGDMGQLDPSLGKGARTFRLVKNYDNVELYIDGALALTMPSDPYAVGSILFDLGAYDSDYMPPYQAAWDYVAYTRGAYTPAQLPSPTRPPALTLRLSLTKNQLPPSKLDGVTPSETGVLIRAVDAGDNPVADQTVVVSAQAVPDSGGHDGSAHDEPRPTGRFVGGTCAAGVSGCSVECTTNSNGDCLTSGAAPVYAASQFGGEEKISAALSATPTLSTSSMLSVAIPALVEFPASSNLYPFNQWRLTGQVTSASSKCPNLSIHPSNHWVTSQTRGAIVSALEEFYQASSIRVGVNDESLKNGGLFDICGHWAPPHHCHRTGEAVDIDAENLGGLHGVATQLLTSIMRRYGGRQIVEGASLHYQFSGTEIQRAGCNPRP